MGINIFLNYLVIISTLLLLTAHIMNMLLPECDQCYIEVIPLILVGLGYSIYAAALWASIPYVVEAKSAGTAFGFCTAIQNTGMALAPTIGGAIKDYTEGKVYGYFWLGYFWTWMALLGLCLNIWLYFEDKWHNNGVLDMVHKGEQITDLISSPKIDKRKIAQNRNISKNAKQYFLNSPKRSMLRRSLAQTRR